MHFNKWGNSYFFFAGMYQRCTRMMYQIYALEKHHLKQYEHISESMNSFPVRTHIYIYVYFSWFLIEIPSEFKKFYLPKNHGRSEAPPAPFGSPPPPRRSGRSAPQRWALRGGSWTATVPGAGKSWKTEEKSSYDINGHFRNLNWRYLPLPYIRPM